MSTLFDTMLEFCDDQFRNSECGGCGHYEGCPGNPCGNCKLCLEEVHYRQRHPHGWNDYGCDRMMRFYVCAYSEKYASEMLYLMRRSAAMREIDKYHVLSIGCGACPDLMALEKYCEEGDAAKKVYYYGMDINERWQPIHERISAYKTPALIKTSFCYRDAVDDEYTIADANVVVLQYVISHFYNSGQIDRIQSFFRKLIDSIIRHKQEGLPMAVLINDINSSYKGRDYFNDLVMALGEAGIHGQYSQYYFPYNIKHQSQIYGTRHDTCRTLFNTPDSYEDIYEPWHSCSSAQLLIEVR